MGTLIVLRIESCEARLSGPVENEWIGCSHEIVIIHGLKSGNNVCQPSNELRGEVLVQQDAHGLAVAVSRVRHLRRKRVNGCEVLLFETRMLTENLIFGHSVGEPSENIIDRDAHAADARLAVPLVGFDRNARVGGRHNSIMAQSLAAVRCEV